MSRVGKNPIDLPQGVEVKIERNKVIVKGPKGSLERDVSPQIKLSLKDGQLLVGRPNNSNYYKSLHGLYRTLLSNMVQGVAEGFERKLEIIGVGYKAEMAKDRLNLTLGYSHPIVFVPPDHIEIAMEGTTNITIRGIDKELVGQVAAIIRSFRPPEPYKGKGIKYVEEHVRRKAGKTAA